MPPLCAAPLPPRRLWLSPCRAEKALAAKISEATDSLFDHCSALEETMLHLPEDRASQSMYYCKTVIPPWRPPVLTPTG